MLLDEAEEAFDAERQSGEQGEGDLLEAGRCAWMRAFKLSFKKRAPGAAEQYLLLGNRTIDAVEFARREEEWPIGEIIRTMVRVVEARLAPVEPLLAGEQRHGRKAGRAYATLRMTGRPWTRAPQDSCETSPCWALVIQDAGNTAEIEHKTRAPPAHAERT